MKTLNTCIHVCLALFCLVLTSCERLPGEDFPKEDEIVFRDAGLAPMGTKATEVTVMNSFYVSAVTGSAGSDTEAWSNVTFSKVGATSDYTGGKYWPGSDPSYRFYASNVSMTYASGGPTISASNATDVVCTYLSSATYKSSNALTFNHIFTRLSTVTVAADSKYDISNITVWIRNVKTGGTYNLYTGDGYADGTGWSALTPAASPDTQVFSYAGSLAPSTSQTGSDNDLYFVPGSYTLVASWTAHVNDYTGEYTQVSSTAPVSFAAGVTNTVAVILSGSEIRVKIGTTDDVPWAAGGAKDDTIRWGEDLLPGLFTVSSNGRAVQFSPGNLQARISAGPTNSYVWAADAWRFAANQWDCSNQPLGIGNWVDHFAWVGAGATYDSYGLLSIGSNNATYHGNSDSEALKTEWGDIAGVVSELGPRWRTLTSAEWAYLFNTRTTSSNVRYAKGTVNGITGVIVLPDNWSTSYYALASANTSNAAFSANVISASDWESILEPRGAVFLPAAGYRNGNSIGDVGAGGRYWSSTPNTDSNIDILYFAPGFVYTSANGARSYGFSVRPVHVVETRNITYASIGTISAYSYDGTAKQPHPTVTYDALTLTEGTHYDLYWSNNINAGTATVTVTGKGIYTGTQSKTFTINRAAGTITLNKTLLTVNKGYSSTITATLSPYESGATVSASSGNTSYYTASASSVSSGSSTITINGVASGVATNCTISASSANYTYTSKTAKVHVTPKADLIDVVFNTNGSITDNSGALTWTKVGSPSVSYNSTYQRNEVTISNTSSSGVSNAYYSSTYSNDFKNKLADGFSQEVFIRPNAVNSRQTILGTLENGGHAILIAANGKIEIGNSIGSTTTLYSTTTLTANTYYHVVMVWSKSSGFLKVYINGVLDASDTASRTGSYAFPVNLRFTIGADLAASGNPPLETNAKRYNGKILIARVYDSVLSDSDVSALYNAAANP